MILRHKIDSPEKKQKLHILILLAGFSGTVIQVLMVREFTSLFQGNEIMMSWTIGIWMILTGAGSYAGSRIKDQRAERISLTKVLCFVTSSPVLLLLLLHLVKSRFILPGMLISPLLYLGLTTVLLAPVCFLSGLLFVLFIQQKKDRGLFIRIYVLEAAGSIAGGLAVSFLLVTWFTVFQSLLILASLAVAVLFLYTRKSCYAWLSGLCLTGLLTLFFLPIENRLRSIALGGANVIVNTESPQGNITVTENGSEYNFFLNGILLFNSGNYIQAEEFVHYAMLQHAHPSSVLLISGGAFGMAKEILKYPGIRRIDYLEINKKLTRLAYQYNPLPDTSLLNIRHNDINTFLRRSEAKYDIVILAVPDPSSVQLNRYYSGELISQLKTKLNDNAVIIYGVAPTGNYMSSWQQKKMSLIFHTLKSHFKHVTVIPGDKDYLIASDSVINPEIVALYNKAGIQNYYVNNNYLDDALLLQRSKAIQQQIEEGSAINTHDKALPVFYSTLKFLTQFSPKTGWILLFPLLIILVLLILPGRNVRGMFLAGFSGASAELMLLFILQVAFGYLYAMIGILIALFMAGLVIGAEAGRKSGISVKKYRYAFLILILFFLVFYLFLQTSYTWLPGYILWPVLILFMLIPSGLTGYIFVAATVLNTYEERKAAPLVYFADLLGSSLGMMSMTMLLIPLAGLANSCLLLMVLNALPLFSRKK